MGKKIVGASAWTCRSIWLFCNKTVTMLFAAFCVISGFFSKTASAEDVTLRGKVYNGADSSILANIKLYLCSVVMPLYGVGYNPYFSPLDSVYTDESGNFQFTLPEQKMGGEVAFVKKDSENSAYFDSVSAQLVLLDTIASDTINVYLDPVKRTEVKKSLTLKEVSFAKAVQGNKISVKVMNWSESKDYSVKIVNAAGKLIESPEISADGLIIWNMQNYAKGLYFLRIEKNNALLSTQALIK